MANINKDYNITEADKIFNKYNSLCTFDPLIKTRETKAVYFRALLYKVLMHFNYMNDRQVADYFLLKGKKTNRVSILQAVKKTGIYYRDFSDFRTLYDVYFGDNAQIRRLIEEKKENIIIKNKKRFAKRIPNRINDKLHNFVDTIPKDRQQEILERLQLMVKSWSWKSKDRCEIIEASEGIENNTF
jgi:hypothetical protein